LRYKLTVAVSFKKRDVIDAYEAVGPVVAPHAFNDNLEREAFLQTDRQSYVCVNPELLEQVGLSILKY
jgi:hypothetical protein